MSRKLRDHIQMLANIRRNESGKAVKLGDLIREALIAQYPIEELKEREVTTPPIICVKCNRPNKDGETTYFEFTYLKTDLSDEEVSFCPRCAEEFQNEPVSWDFLCFEPLNEKILKERHKSLVSEL